MVRLTGKILLLTSIILMVCGSLAGCTAPASPTATPSQPAPVLPSSTFTPTPLPSPTATPSPSATPSLTPTPTYLPITPALQGTAVPGSNGVISAANADRLTLLARWGLGNPNDLVYTPDGQYLIAACTTGVYFYDPADYALVRQIDTLDRALHLAVSPDSQLLAVAGPAQVYLYQLSDLQLLNTFSGPADSLDFSPDGQVLAVGRSSDPTATIQLRDVLSGEILGVISSDMGIWSVHFAPQGGFIASGGYSTKVWSLDGTLTTEQGPYVSGGWTPTISFSPDGSLLAEGSDYEIHLWRLLENGRLTHVRQLDLTAFDYASIHEVAFSPDGSMVAATLDTGIFAWNLETGYRIFSATADSYIKYSGLAWSANSRQLATASPDFGVQVWDVPGEALLASLPSLSGSYTAIAWSPDGQRLAAGSAEGWADLISTQQGDLLQRLGSGFNLNSLAFAPDGVYLALGDQNSVEFWTVDGSLAHTLEGYWYATTEVRFSTGGELFSVNFSDDRQAEQASVWNTADWSLASTFPVGPWDEYQITGFDLAPDLQTAAISLIVSTGYNDQDSVRIVAYPGGELVTTLEPERGRIKSASYSPSGEMFAIISASYQMGQRLQVWRTSDWTELYTVIGAPGQTTSSWLAARGWLVSEQDSLAWSPDSTLLAIGSSNGSLQLFNAANGKLLITLPGHRMWAPALAFSPDGRWLASCSLDGTIMLWGVR